MSPYSQNPNKPLGEAQRPYSRSRVSGHVRGEETLGCRDLF